MVPAIDDQVEEVGITEEEEFTEAAAVGVVDQQQTTVALTPHGMTWFQIPSSIQIGRRSRDWREVLLRCLGEFTPELCHDIH